MNSIVASLVAIVFCGSTGGILAWLLVHWLAIDGTVGALIAAVLGTVIATLFFVAIIALLRVQRGGK